MSQKLRKRTVLLVDDEPEILSFLEKMLRACNYAVLKASDGVAALKIISREKPDLVLTDLMMPEMSGYALIRILKQDPATAGIPVIMISCKGTVDEVNKGLECGADDHVSKPVDFNLLLPKIAKIFSVQETPPDNTKDAQ